MGLNIPGESSDCATNNGFLGVHSGLFKEKLDFSLVKALNLEIGKFDFSPVESLDLKISEGIVDTSTCDDNNKLALLNFLMLSLCSCLMTILANENRYYIINKEKP